MLLVKKDEIQTLQDKFDTHDLDSAIALIDQHENQLIKYDDLPAINEEEIKKMILSEEEKNFKDRVWKNLNKQWIAEQNEKKR